MLEFSKLEKQILKLLKGKKLITTRHSDGESKTTELFVNKLTKEMKTTTHCETISDLMTASIKKVLSQECNMDKKMLDVATSFMKNLVYGDKDASFERDLKHILETGEEPFRRYIG